jgi:hypothetical protein
LDEKIWNAIPTNKIGRRKKSDERKDDRNTGKEYGLGGNSNITLGGGTLNSLAGGNTI